MGDSVEAVLVKDELVGLLLEDAGAAEAFAESVAHGVREAVGREDFYVSMIDPGRLAGAIEAGKAWRPVRSQAVTIKEAVHSAILGGKADFRGALDAGIRQAVSRGVEVYRQAKGGAAPAVGAATSGRDDEAWRNFYAKSTPGR